MVTQNKLVEMMADWYKKADKAEKASILSWLISQE
ncbi:VvgS protein [Vibrio cholerae]|nr:VvgS protein [Vibrio cholerae]